MEPIFLKPIYKDYIWGGMKLKTYLKKDTQYKQTAESWEISTHKNGINIIKNGQFRGLTLADLFNDKKNKIKIFGNKCENLDEFPILIKFIDASQNLSVQVHPNDEYALKNENSLGKNEMWYIMDAEKDAKIIYGFKENITQEHLKNIINSNNIEEYLNYVNIKKGDSIFIEAGTVHAILSGCLICEIQQNSDLTYRIYDWNRKDIKERRPLNIDKALDVIKLNNNLSIRHRTNETVQNLAKSKYFNADLIMVNDSFKDKTNCNTFYAYNVVFGNGLIKENNVDYRINIGDSFIIPACLGEYKIEGKIELLKTYI